MTKETRINYNFGEKTKEYHSGQSKELPVWQSPKYLQSKNKAIELIKVGKYDLDEGDFWILKNATKSGKMMYTGLIISHNGCLKINDNLDANFKFKPSCVTFVKDEADKVKVMQYINDEQGVYEFGEISPKNCMNDYPYAMVLKRLMDRVILKNSKVGFFGIYSDSESEDFKEKLEPEKDTKEKSIVKKISNVIDDDSKEVLNTMNKESSNIIMEALSEATSKDSLDEIYNEYKPEMAKLYKYNLTLFNEVKQFKEDLSTQLQ